MSWIVHEFEFQNGKDIMTEYKILHEISNAARALTNCLRATNNEANLAIKRRLIGFQHQFEKELTDLVTTLDVYYENNGHKKDDKDVWWLTFEKASQSPNKTTTARIHTSRDKLDTYLKTQVYGHYMASLSCNVYEIFPDQALKKIKNVTNRMEIEMHRRAKEKGA